MSTGNPNYTISPALYTAVKDAFGHEINKGDWRSQIERLDPLFSLIAEGSTGPKGQKVGNFNTQEAKSDETGLQLWVTHQLMFDEVAAITADTIGKSINTLPNSFPTYDTFDGVTRAKYPVMYYERPVGFSVAELRAIGKGSRGIIAAKKKAILGAMRRALADQVQSSINATNLRLLGVGYIFSNANSPGEVSQADNTWWRPGYLNPSATGALTWQLLDKYQNKMSYLAQSDGSSAMPDLVMMSTTGSYDLYSAFTQSIMTNQRVIDQAFKDKYGFAPLMWGNARVLPDPRLAAQTIRGLNSKNFYFTGSITPEMSDEARILGSKAMELILSGFACLSIDEMQPHYQVTGHTS